MSSCAKQKQNFPFSISRNSKTERNPIIDVDLGSFQPNPIDSQIRFHSIHFTLHSVFTFYASLRGKHNRYMERRDSTNILGGFHFGREVGSVWVAGVTFSVQNIYDGGIFRSNKQNISQNNKSNGCVN